MNLTVSSPINSGILPSNRTMLKQLSLLAGLMLVMSLFLHGPAHSADNIERAEAHVNGMIATVQARTENKELSKEQRVALFSEIITEYFDIDGIVRYTAGRYWRLATDEEREAYKGLFLTILTQSAAEQFSQLAKLDFTPTTSTARGDKLVLVGGIISDKTGSIPDAEVAWRVVTKDDNPAKIIDIEVENISMLKTQQDENTTIIRRNGGKFSALIEELEKRQQTLLDSASR